MPKIFISYARDKSHGEHLAAETQQQLLAAGFEVFRDVIGLKPGDVWYHKLEFELESSDAVVLIVSEKVRNSKWVHNEISMAEEIGLPVIPVFAEKVRSPLWLRHLQALDFCTQANWPALIAALPIAKVIAPTAPKITLEEHVQVVISAKTDITLKLAEMRSKLTWASASGTDQYGIYADLAFKGVMQRFRYIEADTFLMGAPENEIGRANKYDEKPHKVTLNNSFWLADTCCTQVFWEAVDSNNPSTFKDAPNNPVETVSWNDVQQFLKLLNSSISTLSVRMPTEAEWEFACRAGTTTPYFFGDTIRVDQATFNRVAGRPAPVKSTSANIWGLYEMHGNVWEWTDTWYSVGISKIIRGGAYNSKWNSIRSAKRYPYRLDSKDCTTGFRIAISI